MTSEMTAEDRRIIREADQRAASLTAGPNHADLDILRVQYMQEQNEGLKAMRAAFIQEQTALRELRIAHQRLQMRCAELERQLAQTPKTFKHIETV